MDSLNDTAGAITLALGLYFLGQAVSQIIQATVRCNVSNEGMNAAECVNNVVPGTLYAGCGIILVIAGAKMMKDRGKFM